MIQTSYKILSIPIKKSTFSKEFGFLNPAEPSFLDVVFDSQRRGLTRGSQPLRFLYRECVLWNCKRPDGLRAYAEKLSLDLANGTRPELDLTFLADIKTVSTGTKEATFYLLHQLIEALAGPVFHNLKTVVQILNTPNSDEEVLFLLKEATGQMKKINHIMAAFSHYMPRDAFNEFRPTLGKASGAQSTLRFLDYMLFDTLEVGPLKLLAAFKSQLSPSVSDVYHNTMAEHADPENFKTDAFVRALFIQNFGNDLAVDFPDFLPKATPVSISNVFSSVTVRKALSGFVAERAAFKLHHINIVLDALNHTDPTGTAGTPHKPFLRGSAMRDIQLHHELATDISQRQSRVIRIPDFKLPRKLFTYLARRVDYIIRHYKDNPTAEKLPIVIVSSKQSQEAGLSGFSGWLHQSLKLSGINVVPIVINGDVSFSAMPLGKQAINVLSTLVATRLLTGNNVVINEIPSDIDRSKESDTHTTVLMGASGGLGKSAILAVLGEMAQGIRSKGPLLLTYSSDNKADLMSSLAQELSKKNGVPITCKKVDFLSKDPMTEVLAELKMSGYGKVNTLIITTGIGTATVAHLVGKDATVTQKAGCFYDVNVAGPILAIKQLQNAGLFENEGVGTVVSVVGSVGASDVIYPFDPQDISSKLALEKEVLSLSEQLSFGGTNVHLHVQKPGGLDTPMLRASFLDGLEKEKGKSEIDRLISEGWLTPSAAYANVLVSMANPELGPVFSGQSYSSHAALNMNIIPYGAPLFPSKL